jgi:hypothetical protein
VGRGPWAGVRACRGPGAGAGRRGWSRARTQRGAAGLCAHAPASTTYGGGGSASGTIHTTLPAASVITALLLYTVSLKGPWLVRLMPLVNTRLLAASTSRRLPSGPSCRLHGGTGGVAAGGALHTVPPAPERERSQPVLSCRLVRLSAEVTAAGPVAVEISVGPLPPPSSPPVTAAEGRAGARRGLEAGGWTPGTGAGVGRGGAGLPTSRGGEPGARERAPALGAARRLNTHPRLARAGVAAGSAAAAAAAATMEVVVWGWGAAAPAAAAAAGCGGGRARAM